MQPVLVSRVPAQHATVLARVGDRTLLATANPGLLVSLSNTRATRGTYDSDVKDAKMVASWGAVSWRATTPAGTKVEVSTRSGNTRTPDEAWSDWSAPYTAAEGSPITSPKARYLQWRAVLTGGPATPLLTSVSAAYLQRNVRPRVESITVHPPGVAFQKPFSTGEAEIAGLDEEPIERRLANQGAGASQAGGPSLGRRIYQRGMQTIAWKAEDENQDDLTYSVLVPARRRDRVAYAQDRPHRHPDGVGHLVHAERHLRAEGGRVRRRLEPRRARAQRRARKRQLRHRQHAADA